MAEINCTRQECLNNRKGTCSANTVHHSKAGCDSYVGANELRKQNTNVLHKKRGKYRQNKGVLK